MAARPIQGSLDRTTAKGYRFLGGDTDHYVEEEHRSRRYGIQPGASVRNSRPRSCIFSNLAPRQTRRPDEIMFLLCGFVILAYNAGAGLSVPASYDQRQTGNLNLQVHLKDVHILAVVDTELLDDYTDYDYFYDYADFTVKPGKPITASTTSEPLSVANGTSSTADKFEETTVSMLNESLTVDSDSASLDKIEETTESPASNLDDDASMINVSSTSQKAEMTDKIASAADDGVAASTSLDATSTEPSVEKQAHQAPRKRCRSGYLPVGKGRCRRLQRRQVQLLPLAMKLGPKLLKGLTNNGRSPV
ncbi:hypothetical protein KM043_010406 [Ampulex compressa]|nr:hypothetical protein KM043_010406 [Ampulex compressa]